MNFYETVGGRRFIDGVVPKLISNIEKQTAAIESLTKAVESLSSTKEEPNLYMALSVEYMTNSGRYAIGILSNIEDGKEMSNGIDKVSSAMFSCKIFTDKQDAINYLSDIAGSNWEDRT